MSVMTYFNNCQGRSHAALYPAGVFYDLNLFGRQATMVRDLEPGDQCIVATPTKTGDIEFGWFLFSHERVMEMPDRPGTEIRVLFGETLRAETLKRAHAIRTEPYSFFFNINGHFKRPSAFARRERER